MDFFSKSRCWSVCALTCTIIFFPPLHPRLYPHFDESDNTRRLYKIIKYHTEILQLPKKRITQSRKEKYRLENIATKMILKYYKENTISNQSIKYSDTKSYYNITLNSDAFTMGNFKKGKRQIHRKHFTTTKLGKFTHEAAKGHIKPEMLDIY